MSDVASEFGEVRIVRRRFFQWRIAHPASYEQTYMHLCLPTLLSPLVRIQLLEWRPTRSGAISSQSWHAELSRLAETEAEKDGSGRTSVPEEEAALLAQLTCKLALPRVQHAVQFAWEVHAPAEAGELVVAVREVRDAAELLARGAEAAVGTEDEEEEAAAAAAAAVAVALRGELLYFG